MSFINLLAFSRDFFFKYQEYIILFVIIAVVFGAGWTVRGWREAALRENANTAQDASRVLKNNENNGVSSVYEKQFADYLQQSENNKPAIKQMYLDGSFKCAIPANGVQLLEAVTNSKH